MNSAQSIAAIPAAPPRVRLYVVDPRNYRKLSTESTVITSVATESPRFLLPKAAPAAAAQDNKTNNNMISTINTATSGTAPVRLLNGHHGQHSQVETDKPTKINAAKKKKPRKRKADTNQNGDSETDTKLKVFLATESTTRAGRLSKNPPRLSCQSSAAAAAATLISAEPAPKIRIREPPEIFRCQGCQKVYLGHTKLSHHYKTFPDHQIKNSLATTVPQNFQNLNPSSNQSTGVLGKSATQTQEGSPVLVSIGVQVSMPPETPTHRNLEGPSYFSKPLLPLVPGNRVSCSESGIRMMRGISDTAEATTVPSSTLLSDSLLNQTDSSLERITVPDLCLPVSLSPTPSQKQQNGFSAPSNTFGENAFSRFRRVSFDINLLGAQHQHQSIFQNLPGPAGSAAARPYPPPYTPPPGENSNNEKNSPVLKAIWEFVEDRIIQQGISQILAELSEVAERLSKIARDKFIPIREEEERLYSSSPIVQVDNPFLSHLLDLPFGTYVFREDAGVRIKAPPPPSAAELSLTGEVDVDKFVSPDILNLPHLTNIDLAAIL